MPPGSEDHSVVQSPVIHLEQSNVVSAHVFVMKTASSVDVPTVTKTLSAELQNDDFSKMQVLRPAP